jgi:glycosyltransferase involved in cell wall biosynthesis
LKDWKTVLSANPKNLLAVRMRILQLRVAGDTAQTLALIAKLIETLPENTETRILEADLMNDAGLFEESDAAYEALLNEDPGLVSARFNYVRQTFKRGTVGTAIAHSAGLEDGDPAARRLAAQLTEIRGALERFAPQALAVGADARPFVIGEAIRRFSRRVPRATAPGRVGSVALITSQLGPGGAERQFSLLARELHARMGQRCATFPEIVFKGPVHALSLAPLQGRLAFYVPLLGETGLDISAADQLGRAPLVSSEVLGEDFDILFPILLDEMKDTTLRVEPWLRQLAPEAVAIWQDGAIVLGAFAALLAGVPKIQLNLRGASPHVRPEQVVGNYRELYRALAEVPGVEYQCNARKTAQSYAAWLGIPPERFEVVANGVEPPRAAGSADDHAAWAAFSAATADADRTIGVIGRLHPVKRVALWLEFAQGYLARHPRARFIVVGDGPQGAMLRTRAEELGLSERLLFVGLTEDVGYWLERLDVFLTLSSNEGMPNVLLEAQISGVPVVSTPAADAPACYVEGVTGATVSDLDDPDPGEVMDLVDQMLARRRACADFGNQARAHAGRYTVDGMVERYLASLCRRNPAGGGIPAPKDQP